MTPHLPLTRIGRTDRSVSGFALCFLLSAVGCGHDTTSPSTPELHPTLASASGGTLLFRQMSAGATHTCGVTMDSVAYCWGFNWAGQIGDGSTVEERPLPTAVAGGHLFSAVTAGADHSCGVTLAKQVYCWGRNSEGELGDGTLENRATPVLVTGGRRFVAVDAGTIHTCAVEEFSSRAFCWGSNHGGALGDGTFSNRASPVLVWGGFRWLQVSAGNGHTCGVTIVDAYCWGNNGNGQLGDSSRFLRPQPSAVRGGIRFRQVSAGGHHSCGVTRDDAVYCWGYNGLGQLGDGTTTGRSVPTAIANQRTWSQVSASYEHTCALTLSQRAWCWGNNGSGRLGDGTTVKRLKPVLVGGGMPFRQVTAGFQHSCGVSRLRPGYCWGANGIGQLGVIPHGVYPSPTQVFAPR